MLTLNLILFCFSFSTQRESRRSLRLVIETKEVIISVSVSSFLRNGLTNECRDSCVELYLYSVVLIVYRSYHYMNLGQS